MTEARLQLHQAISRAAYLIWEKEGRPHGRSADHWARAAAQVARARGEDAEPIEDEEKVLAGRMDANIPAMLTKDVPGG
jgi:Protein of unknown function (DUF2934)